MNTDNSVKRRTMPKKKKNFNKPDLSHPLNRMLDECLARVSTFQAAEILWNTVLSGDEKKELVCEVKKTMTLQKLPRKGIRNSEEKSDVELDTVFKQFQAIGMFMKTRRINNPYIAAIKIAEEIELITPKTAEKLLIALEEKTKKTAMDKPSWDRLNSCLMFRHEEIRSIQTRNKPTNPVVLLEIFEKDNWPQQIESPPEWDNEKIRETLRTLNSGLKIINFERRNGSRTIQWRVA